MSCYAEAHKITNLRGPEDARPTALEVIKDKSLLDKLTNKVFLVTSVSSGIDIGIDTLRALHTIGGRPQHAQRPESRRPNPLQEAS